MPGTNLVARNTGTQLAANLAGDALLKKAKMKKVVCNRMNGSDGVMNFGEKGAIVIACVCSRANWGTKHDDSVRE